MVFVRFPANAVTWSVQPETFASSNFVERGFCKSCGTPLTYRMINGSNISLTLNSLDDPMIMPSPTASFVTEQQAAWLSNLNCLHREEGDLTTSPGFESHQSS